MKFLIITFLACSYFHFANATIVCKDANHISYVIDEEFGESPFFTLLDEFGRDKTKNIQLEYFSEHSGPIQSILVFGVADGIKFVINADGALDDKSITGVIFKFEDPVKDTVICCERESSFQDFQGCFFGM